MRFNDRVRPPTIIYWAIGQVALLVLQLFPLLFSAKQLLLKESFQFEYTRTPLICLFYP